MSLIKLVKAGFFFWKAIVPEQFIKTLNSLGESAEVVLLSSYIAMIKTLLIKSSDCENVIHALFSLMNLENDNRVLSNIIEGLGFLIDDPVKIYPLLDNANNRIKGNVIIFLGRDKITAQLKREIENLINDKRPAFIATGLFVESYLYQHHYQFNYVYSQTEEWISKLPSHIKNFKDHSDEIVRKRAQISLEQIYDLTKKTKIASNNHCT